MARMLEREHSGYDEIMGSLETEILLKATLYLIGNNSIKKTNHRVSRHGELKSLFAGELPGPDDVSMACLVPEILRECNTKTCDTSRHSPVYTLQNILAWS